MEADAYPFGKGGYKRLQQLYPDKPSGEISTSVTALGNVRLRARPDDGSGPSRPVT